MIGTLSGDIDVYISVRLVVILTKSNIHQDQQQYR